MQNLKNFFNEILNDNRIYTAEDIDLMTVKEFLENEKAINYQLENLGIPRQNQLNGNPDVIYVHAYIRADGTHVKAHYRSKSGGKLQETVTGAAANNSQSKILKDDYTAKLNKNFLDFAINFLGLIMQQNDAVNFWNIASNSSILDNYEYINKNGKLYYSIYKLNNEYSKYKTKIKEKVKSQFHKEDIPGIVFHEKSTVANAIASSQELHNFIYNNIKDLKAGKKVTGSLSFHGFTNLHNAFGKIDVLSAKLKDNYVDVILLDTYDFNENDSNFIVQMGYSAQKAKLLNPYFTIVKCRYKL